MSKSVPTVRYIPDALSQPSLYEGNDRQRLIDERKAALQTLEGERGATKTSLTVREAARVALAKIDARADAAGLYVGQIAPTGKVRQDMKKISELVLDAEIKMRVSIHRRAAELRIQGVPL